MIHCWPKAWQRVERNEICLLKSTPKSNGSWVLHSPNLERNKVVSTRTFQNFMTALHGTSRFKTYISWHHLLQPPALTGVESFFVHWLPWILPFYLASNLHACTAIFSARRTVKGCSFQRTRVNKARWERQMRRFSKWCYISLPQHNSSFKTFLGPMLGGRRVLHNKCFLSYSPKKEVLDHREKSLGCHGPALKQECLQPQSKEVP